MQQCVQQRRVQFVCAAIVCVHLCMEKCAFVYTVMCIRVCGSVNFVHVYAAVLH